MRTTILGLILAFGLGVLAAQLSWSIASSTAVGVILVPLLAFGLAPLPSLAIIRPRGFFRALRLAAILQVAVVVGAGTTDGVLQRTWLPGTIGLVAYYGSIEFMLITIPAIAVFLRVFSRP